ncbi:MAG: hypothetical protein ACM3ZE_28020, partial [Myxococcales bacterium]
MPSGRGPNHHQRKRPDRQAAPISPKQVVVRAQTLPQTATPVEEPLSAKEIAQLKVHFKFLRDHRQVLKLRVNAAEDLLLNGVKEPTHRGLCQHLLAKVERSRVLTVSQTLPPPEAVKLLEGVLRFAPEISFILRYLECVKQTSSQQQAGAALTEVLERIDYKELSAAQVRQLVLLIVDVFSERDLPVFLFTLLYDISFRDALDRSLEGFPEVLFRMVRPLRALHEVIAQGSRRHERALDTDTIRAGVGLLLDVNPLSLITLPESARRRLFYLGCEILRADHALRGEVLERLLASLNMSDAGQKTSATLLLTGSLLASGDDAAAKRILDREFAAGDHNPTLVRWREALEGQRIGSVALDSSRSRNDRPPPGRWYRGLHLPTQSVVLVRSGNADELALYQEQVGLWRGLTIPAVSRIVAASTNANTRPYLAVDLPGSPLSRELKGPNRVAESIRLRWAIEVTCILATLAQQGVVLADAELRRFNTDDLGHLWLVDLWPLRRTSVEEAAEMHLGYIKTAAQQFVRAAPCYSIAADGSERLEQVR